MFVWPLKLSVGAENRQRKAPSFGCLLQVIVQCIASLLVLVDPTPHCPPVGLPSWCFAVTLKQVGEKQPPQGTRKYSYRKRILRLTLTCTITCTTHLCILWCWQRPKWTQHCRNGLLCHHRWQGTRWTHYGPHSLQGSEGLPQEVSHHPWDIRRLVEWCEWWVDGRSASVRLNWCARKHSCLCVAFAQFHSPRQHNDPMPIREAEWDGGEL